MNYGNSDKKVKGSKKCSIKRTIMITNIFKKFVIK